MARTSSLVESRDFTFFKERLEVILENGNPGVLTDLKKLDENSLIELVFYDSSCNHVRNILARNKFCSMDESTGKLTRMRFDVICPRP